MSWTGKFLTKVIPSIRLGNEIGLAANVGTTGNIKILMRDDAFDILFATGTDVPTSATSGYAKGCLFIDRDVAAGTKALYENIGSNTSCNFNLIGAITADEITLAEGNILLGNSSGVAAALDASGDTKVLVGNGTTITSVALSGDVTMANTGAVTIATGAVEDSMIEGLADGEFIIGVDGTAANNAKVTMSGDGTLANDGAFTLVTAGDATAAEVTQSSDISAQNSKITPSSVITASAAAIKQSVIQHGDIIETTLFIDLAGLKSVATLGDIIGDTGVSYIAQITAAINGTIFAGEMGCSEVPTTGDDDIDLYSATEGTGAYDGAIADLVETALVNAGGAHAIGTVKPLTALPAANEYLYLTSGAGDTAGTYDAGQIYIKLLGYA